MTVTITDQMLHHLVAGSHAEGTTRLAVAAAVEHHEHTLLVAVPGDDFDVAWQLPTDLVLPGETLLDALDRTLTVTTGLHVADVTGYAGHHDRVIDGDVVRTFVFTITTPDPEHLCHTANIGHRWTHDPITASDVFGDHTPTTTTAASRNGHPPYRLPAALRASARGLPCVEAAVDLLIDQQSWLRRADFVDAFIQGPAQASPPQRGHPDTAFVDWTAALTALNTSHLPCSSGEGRLLRIAASLAEGLPVDLRDALTSLDTTTTMLVVQAIRHATDHQP